MDLQSIFHVGKLFSIQIALKQPTFESKLIHCRLFKGKLNQIQKKLL